jgi:alpha-tubulin suppressor-like RCC1 family protein
MTERVVEVACGALHTIIRTNVNRLFSTGNGGSYALGHGNRESTPNFLEIESFKSERVQIKKIACGMNHSAIITQDGKVYQWGVCGDIQES